MRKTLRMVPALLLALTLGACDTDSLLDLQPLDEISSDIAITDATSAQAALNGAYSALQSTAYYGGDYVLWSETLTNNLMHEGTFDQYADADLLFLRPDMGGIDGMWTALYNGINRVNEIIQKVPEIDNIDGGTANAILGQAYALRALHYFNLVRAWGEVPLVLVPPATLDEAAQVSRAPVGQVYSQIDADLSQSATLLGGGGDDRTLITPGFIPAIRARIALYREDWAGAIAAARQVQTSGNYGLAGSYGSLFTPQGDATSEDIFRVLFEGTDQNNQGFYMQYGGRFEIGATQNIYNAFPDGDLRHDWTFGGTGDGIEVVKYPTTQGFEDIHVIRYGEILLILAEALAEQGGTANLQEAIGYVNDLRTRAGVAGYIFGVDVTSQAEVLEAIYLERRLELAFEGEYWFDLVRTNRAAATLGPNFDAHEALWPIPIAERDVAPNLTQNPGYGG
jgi:hypothetical protein